MEKKDKKQQYRREFNSQEIIDKKWCESTPGGKKNDNDQSDIFRVPGHRSSPVVYR